jgi:hypothetical protein
VVAVEPFKELERRLIRYPEPPLNPVVGSKDLLVGIYEDATSAITRSSPVLRRAHERVLFACEVIESQ